MSARSSNSLDQHIGKRIRERRTEIGLSQDALAKCLGVSFQQVQKYESGANRIAASRLYILAKTLDVDLSFFFKGLPNVIVGSRKKAKIAT